MFLAYHLFIIFFREDTLFMLPPLMEMVLLYSFSNLNLLLFFCFNFSFLQLSYVHDFYYYLKKKKEGELNGLEEESCSNKRLKIFRADTFDYQSITNAIRGCSCLFYSFEPNLEECSYDVSHYCSLIF